jgi:hypothetical protein
MGLTDFSSKVITFFQADTSDMKAGLKELTGEEKKVAQAQLESAEQRNKGLESWVKGLGNANQALELVGKAVEFGKDAFKEYAEDLRMRAAAGAIDIDRLKEASLGLRTEDELLAFAAKTQHGAFKLTQEQMELAQKAMVGLTRAGFDQATVVDKVTEALVTGKTRGLKEFGIAVKATGDETESLNAIMGELATKASGVQNGSRTAGEEVQAMGVSMGDSMDNMKEAIGKLVTAMGPLLNMLAKAVGLVAHAAEWALGDGDGAVAMFGKEAGEKVSAYMKGQASLREEIMKEARSYFYQDQVMNGRVDLAASHDVDREDPWAKQNLYSNGKSIDEGRLATTFGRLPKGSKAGTDTAGPSFTMLNFGRDVQGTTDDLVEAFQNALAASIKKAGEAAKGGQDIIDAEHQKKIDEQTAYFRGQEITKLAQKAAGKQRETSFLESTFGKIDDFNAYAQAFSMLTGSVTAGLNAWIDGSESAGTAIKKFIASALKGLASQMAVEALKHGAYALGSLAFGDVAGAGAHAAAAAAFGAGAAAAAVAAKELGGGGSTAKSSGGASAGGAPGFGGGANDHRSGEGGGKQGNVTYVIPYGDAFFELSETGKRRKAQEIVDRAQPGAHGYTNS